MSKTCLFIVLFLASTSSVAQQQSHVDAATELFEAMNKEELIEQTYERVLSQMPEMIEQMGVPKERQSKYDRYMEEALVVLKEVASLKKMKPLFVTTYTEVFTEAELRELTDFYTSPIGRKYIERQPELAQAAFKVMGEMMRDLKLRLEEIQIETLSEAKESPAGGH